MYKRGVIRWSLILVVLAAFAVWLEPTRVVWGWLRGEAFYQRRPTSYWEIELSQWKLINTWHGDDIVYKSGRLRRTLETYVPFLGVNATPSVVRGYPHSRAVLQELCNSSSPRIRQLALHGLANIEAHEKQIMDRFMARQNDHSPTSGHFR